MKITKTENKVLDFIKNHIDMFFIIAVILISLAVRYALLDFKSNDLRIFLEPWFNNMKDGFYSIKNYTGDYNAPYVTIMAALTYLPGKAIYLIKGLSISFDYICAFAGALLVYKLMIKNAKRKLYAMLTFTLIIFLPTVILNGAFWGQCDSMYTSFVLFSLGYLIEEKYTKSFIFLGLAFAFKLQFIFILPLYVYLYFTKRKFSIANFLIIPGINILCCIPAMLFGKSFISCMLTYASQTTTYANSLVLNFPNIYQLVGKLPKYFTSVGILITITAFGALLCYLIKINVKWTQEKIITVGIWSVLIALLLLPGMHDRYMFVADILSVIWFIVYRKKPIIPILICSLSLFTYSSYLFGIQVVSFRILAIVYIGLCMYFTSYTLKKVNE